MEGFCGYLQGPVPHMLFGQLSDLWGVTHGAIFLTVQPLLWAAPTLAPSSSMIPRSLPHLAEALAFQIASLERPYPRSLPSSPWISLSPRASTCVLLTVLHNEFTDPRGV